MDQSRLLINNECWEEQKVIDILFNVKLRNKVAVSIWKNELFFFEWKKNTVTYSNIKCVSTTDKGFTYLKRVNFVYVSKDNFRFSKFFKHSDEINESSYLVR